jgi:hypothetical protein
MEKNNLENSIKLIGIGIVIGVVIAIFLNFLGAKFTKFSLFGMDFEIPTPTIMPAVNLAPTNETPSQTQINKAEPITNLYVDINTVFNMTQNRYVGLFYIADSSTKSLDDIIVTISSRLEYPLKSCSVSAPYDNIQPRQSQEGSLYKLIINIPTLAPAQIISISCENRDWGISFLQKYGVYPEKIPNARCENANDLSSLLPTLDVVARDTLPMEVKYVCH